MLIDLLSGDPESARAACGALDGAAARGAVVLCPVVYAELLAYPGRRQEHVDDFVRRTSIVVVWELSPSVWRMAGGAFAAYSARRRASGGEGPRRLLADFIVGAHAFEVGALLTRDLGFYRANFPDLPLYSPG